MFFILLWKSAPLKYVYKWLVHNTFKWESNFATLVNCFHQSERQKLFNHMMTIISCSSWHLLWVWTSVRMLLCCGYVSAGGCVWIVHHVAGFDDWPLEHVLRFYWCGVKSTISLRSTAVHTKNMVSGWKVENSRKGNEVNNLFPGPSLNRITNEFPVADEELFHDFLPSNSCSCSHILLQVWASLKLECKMNKVIISGWNYTQTVSLWKETLALYDREKNGPG